MKRVLATGFIVAFATFGVAGAANAAPADAACVGQVHRPFAAFLPEQSTLSGGAGPSAGSTICLPLESPSCSWLPRCSLPEPEILVCRRASASIRAFVMLWAWM